MMAKKKSDWPTIVEIPLDPDQQRKIREAQERGAGVEEIRKLAQMPAFDRERERRILEALGEGAGNEQIEDIRIYLHTYIALAKAQLEHPRPRPKNDRDELKTVKRLAEALIETLDSISVSAWVRLQGRFHDRELAADYPYVAATKPEAQSHVNFPDMEVVLKRLAAATEITVSPGPQKNQALWRMTFGLGTIWRDFHKEPPRRGYVGPVWRVTRQQFEEGKETGPFHRFVEACLEALPPQYRPAKLPTGLIRETVDQMRRRRHRAESEQPLPEQASTSPGPPPLRRPHESWGAAYLAAHRMEKMQAEQEPPETPRK